jgi:ribosomal protein L11 methyltransferase
MLDIGTGSGVLAIAAACLGAAHALGIDNDSDAIHAARENLSLNPDAAGVAFEVIALGDVRLKPDDTGFAESAGSAGSTRLAAFTGLVGSGSSRTSTLADVVVANLTGALLAREARRILRMVRPGGRLIVSGLLASERGQVLAAFHPAEILWESHEEEWVAITFRASNALAWFPV